MMDSKNIHRIYLSIFFFLSGICFSTWTSRIPTIKESFQLNDGQLATILLCMPISSIAGLLLSGWLVTRFDSRVPLATAFVVMSFCLLLIGFSSSLFSLVASLCLFAFSMRIFNISVNTQAITVQKLFEKKINGSFHGLWSTGGIVGVGFTTLLVAINVSLQVHTLIVAVISIVATAFSYSHLLRNDRSPSGNKLMLSNPDPRIILLGILVFLAAVCEGGMFDWSGLYFKDIVGADLFTLGYLIFMVFMASSRFLSDRLIEAIGMPNTYIFSSFFVCLGILTAIIFPYFWTSMLGFCLVGLGTAPVIPMTYLLAGSSKKYSPGMAISIVATYGIIGMLVGPSLIGYISNAFNLRIAFITFACAGFMLIPISRMFFKRDRIEG